MGRFLFKVEASSPGLELKLLRKIYFLVAGLSSCLEKPRGVRVKSHLRMMPNEREDQPRDEERKCRSDFVS